MKGKISKIIDPYGSELPKDYHKVIKDFGLQTYNHQLPKENRLMRREIVFASRGLDLVIKAIKNKKPFYVLSGIMPTSQKIHFGNKSVVENIKYFQDMGAKTFILVADLESAAARGIDLKEAKKNALEYHIPVYIALGLNPKKTVFYFQSENKHVTNLAYEFASKITLNEYRSIYGNTEPSRIVSALTQVGDILYPQMQEKMPGVIPVGIDQDPHIRLARDVVNRTKSKYGFFLPSGLYHKYTPSLDGKLKMSKSHPESFLELPENPESACRKIRKALSGGKDTLAEHRKHGADVEKDIAFELLKQHLIEDDKKLQRIYNDYKSGKLLTREVKDIACEEITKFMKKLENDVIKARKLVPKLKFVK
ncbi:MAG: tryptophan--tRNA ligase [Nanoarchaeota archaeon]|nr:tryptophan--tRNA ligase [Nanoarchaeota archaeon]